MMKKTLAVLGLSLILVAPAHAGIDSLDNVPAATLLLPYFAVDLSNPNPHTVASIGNVSANEVVAHVVLWTDRGVPTINFDIRLGAYDIEQIDLNALFTSGILPQTTPGTFASCVATLPPANISGSTLSGLQDAHRGRASSLFGGSCAGVNHSDNVARGYATIDVTNQCSSAFPTTPGYFVSGGNGIARNDNVLFGEYTTYDTSAGVAQGDALVAIEASASDPMTDGVVNMLCPSFTTCPVPTPFTLVEDYTFYRRQIGSAADNREALPQEWFGRYVNAGAFTNTTAIVWRDPGSVSPFPCGSPPSGLSLSFLLAFDDQEEPAQNCPSAAPSMPYATQSVDLSDPARIAVPFDAGFVSYGLMLAQPNDAALTTRNQSYVSHVFRTSFDTGQLTTWPLTPASQTLSVNGSFAQGLCPQCSDGIDNDGDGAIDFPNDPGCRSQDGVENPECSDGMDNDGDGQIDFPNDPECWGPLDRSEISTAQCDDGIDNDLDGLTDWPSDPRCFKNPFGTEVEGICGDGMDNDGDGKTDFPADPGCTSRFDNNETDPQCTDGIDNDGDGRTDFPADPGCADANSNIENPQCNDGIDNDGDGKTDFPADPGCASAASNLEGPQCNDGLDNDGDGFIDFPADPGCASALGTKEQPQCSDGVDNDFDGKIDFPADPGCSALSDDSEFTPACSNGTDDDGNGLTDYPTDPGCSSPSDDIERADCSDGMDNDADGLVDFPNDPGCASANDLNELAGTVNRQCSDGLDNDGDGRTDFPRDPGCSSAYDDLEFLPGEPAAAPAAGPVAPTLTPVGLILAVACLLLVGTLGLRRRIRS